MRLATFFSFQPPTAPDQFKAQNLLESNFAGCFRHDLIYGFERLGYILKGFIGIL
jgi:hypothetical protein